MKDCNIPEYFLLKSIKTALRFIKEDLIEKRRQGREKESYLALICEDKKIERYNYFEQAEDLLLRDESEGKLLNVDLMYNMNFDNTPSIYISLSGEQYSDNNLSVEQQSLPLIVGESRFDVFTRRKNANYSIYIVSDNSNEANLLYYILDCICISLTAHFSFSGFYNITHGGQDVQIENDKIPKHIFVKALNIGLQYKRSAPSFYTLPTFNELFFQGRPTGLKNDLNDTLDNDNDL